MRESDAEPTSKQQAYLDLPLRLESKSRRCEPFSALARPREINVRSSASSTSQNQRKKRLNSVCSLSRGCQKTSDLATMSNSPRRADVESPSKSCDRNDISSRVSIEGRTMMKERISYLQAFGALRRRPWRERQETLMFRNPALNPSALEDRLSAEGASLLDALSRRPSLKLARVLVGRRWLRSDEKTASGD